LFWWGTPPKQNKRLPNTNPTKTKQKIAQHEPQQNKTKDCPTRTQPKQNKRLPNTNPLSMYLCVEDIGLTSFYVFVC
jgi:hypothetical protein